MTDEDRTVVFDLGGVLVRLGGVEQMGILADGMTPAQMWQRWLTCPWVRDYERGRCTTDEFAAGLIRDWGLELDPASFLAAFQSWPQGLQPGAAELVAQVRRRSQTVCLSNTNALHWEDQMARGFGLGTMFDGEFLSYRLGMVKPDREVFDHVARTLQRPPAALLLLDDNLPNVQGARDAGWQAEHVHGVEQAREALARHGIIDPLHDEGPTA